MPRRAPCVLVCLPASSPPSTRFQPSVISFPPRAVFIGRARSCRPPSSAYIASPALPTTFKPRAAVLNSWRNASFRHSYAAEIERCVLDFPSPNALFLNDISASGSITDTDPCQNNRYSYAVACAGNRVIGTRLFPCLHEFSTQCCFNSPRSVYASPRRPYGHANFNKRYDIETTFSRFSDRCSQPSPTRQA